MEALGIDLKILIAQIINFGLLLVILKKFLYGPVIKLLDERRKKIQESIENTRKIEERLAKIEEEQKKILVQAQEQAQKERQEIRRQAEKEKETIVEKARQAAQKEFQRGLSSLKDEEAASRARLKEMITAELIEKVEARLVKNLKRKESQHQLIGKILED